MILKLNFKGDTKHFQLDMEANIDMEQDAEALGYITSILHESAMRLSDLMEKSNPKYHNRLAIGVAKSIAEKISEQNENYPFTTFLQKDE